MRVVKVMLLATTQINLTKKHILSHFLSDSRTGMIIIVDQLASKNSITPENPWDNAYHLNVALIHEAGA